MKQRNNKFRAIVLATLMILSVMAGSFALVGTVAADRSTTTFEGSEVEIVPNGTDVFRGEDLGIGALVGANPGGNTSITNLIHIETGESLTTDIETTATKGRYSTDGTADAIGFVTVVDPKIDDFEITNLENSDVSGGTLVVSDSAPTGFINGTANFVASEDVSISVTKDGNSVTNEFIVDPSDQSSTEFSYQIDENVDTGTYTVTVEGTDSLDFGDATQSATVEIVQDEAVTISTESSEVVQGEDLDFTIEGGVDGQYHAVLIDIDDNSSAHSVESDSVFRDVSDSEDLFQGYINNNNATGTVTSNVDASNVTHFAAILEVDGGAATGSIDTTFLDTDTITLEVYDASGDSVDYYNGSAWTSNLSDVTVDDDVDFSVEDGAVELTSPEGQYVIGEQVDITGTATAGVDSVALYVRSSNTWERLNVGGSDREINVESDQTFELEDVVLSNSSDNLGAGLLSQVGSYRIAVVDATNLDASTTDTLSTDAFNDETTDTNSIVTTTEDLSVTFATYNGQISNDDNILTITGSSLTDSGSDVVIAVVDSRGDVKAEAHTVDADDGEIDADVDISSLDDGSLSAHVISPGRDGLFGQSETDASSLVSSISGFSGTADQVRDKIIASTTDDTASDDTMASTTFRKANSLTSVEVPAEVETGSTLTVEGQTNRNPNDPIDAEITVEVFNDAGGSEAIATTGDWNSDGVWSVELDLSELSTGSYAVEASDSQSSDRAVFEIVDEVPTPTPDPTPTEEPDDPTPTPEPTEEPAEETPADTPGFGLIVALTALVAAGFLALRRLD